MTSPVPTRQAPGVYRQRVGEAVVTAISDGGMAINPAVLRNITEAEAHAMLHAAGRRAPFMTAVNTYLVQTPSRTVLIDTGAGPLMGPTVGRLVEHLVAAGVAPGDVDTVLLTHMHIDHVGGLLNPDGTPAFANADLLVPQAEAAFWLDDAVAAKAPEAAQPSFALAKRMTAPYGKRLHAFTEAEPVPGLIAVPLPGHTPGHTGYQLGAGEAGLLIWGDIFHQPDLQAPNPDVAVMFDTDQSLAIATRRDILARVAAEQIMVAGMHLHFPGFMRIAAVGDGYAVRPLPWMPEL